MSKFLQHVRRHTAAVLALGLAMAAPTAWAAGTASGTDITNNAQVQYQVSGVTQTAESNAVTFKVDNVVRVLVSEGNTLATPVIPGASAQVVQFTVTNQGNTTQDYSLATANLPTVPATTLTLGANTYADAFDGTACSIRVESGNNSVYDANDTATSISNLAPDASVTVYVICNIPLSLANGLDAIVSLTATTANATTCTISCTTTTQTAGVDNPAEVDVVFGDIAGTDDSVRDGKHSARDAYEITTASLSITKTVTPICDPFNFNSNPKNVPGAYVRYAITISNATGSGQSATLTNITDALPASLDFDPNLEQALPAACGPVAPATSANPENGAGKGFKLTCAGDSNARPCKTTPVFFTGAASDDAITVYGSSDAGFSSCQGPTMPPGSPARDKCFFANGSALLPTVGTTYSAGELKPGESITIHFNAIVK